MVRCMFAIPPLGFCHRVIISVVNCVSVRGIFPLRLIWSWESDVRMLAMAAPTYAWMFHVTAILGNEGTVGS